MKLVRIRNSLFDIGYSFFFIYLDPSPVLGGGNLKENIIARSEATRQSHHQIWNVKSGMWNLNSSFLVRYWIFLFLYMFRPATCLSAEASAKADGRGYFYLSQYKFIWGIVIPAKAGIHLIHTPALPASNGDIRFTRYDSRTYFLTGQAFNRWLAIFRFSQKSNCEVSARLAKG